MKKKEIQIKRTRKKSTKMDKLFILFLLAIAGTTHAQSAPRQTLPLQQAQVEITVPPHSAAKTAFIPTGAPRQALEPGETKNKDGNFPLTAELTTVLSPRSMHLPYTSGR
jgi:hypothetical protein